MNLQGGEVSCYVWSLAAKVKAMEPKATIRVASYSVSKLFSLEIRAGDEPKATA